jgi:hypothetical protein
MVLVSVHEQNRALSRSALAWKAARSRRLDRVSVSLARVTARRRTSFEGDVSKVG